MNPVLLSTALVLLQLSTSLPSASAKSSFVSRIPNGANVDGYSALGHTDPDGKNDALNAFGSDFGKAGNKWTVALCQKDSDGDGQTNGQELGDPCCEWTTASPVVRWTSGISHPGVSSLTSAATLVASVNCSSVTSTTVTGSAAHVAAGAAAVEILLGAMLAAAFA